MAKRNNCKLLDFKYVSPKKSRVGASFGLASTSVNPFPFSHRNGASSSSRRPLFNSTVASPSASAAVEDGGAVQDGSLFYDDDDEHEPASLDQANVLQDGGRYPVDGGGAAEGGNEAVGPMQENVGGIAPGGPWPFERRQGYAGFTELSLFAIYEKFQLPEKCIQALEAVFSSTSFSQRDAIGMGLHRFREMEKSMPVQEAQCIDMQHEDGTAFSFDYISIKGTLEALLQKETFTGKLLVEHVMDEHRRVSTFNESTFYNTHPGLQKQEITLDSGVKVRVGDTIMVDMLSGMGNRQRRQELGHVGAVFEQFNEGGTREPWAKIL